MEKKRKWQLALILSVICLTIYNILPTVFYYAKPLKSPITKERAEKISKEIEKRVDGLKAESIEWLESYCSLLNVKPLYIAEAQNSPGQISLVFSKTDEAQKLRNHLSRAASLIPFYPAQLTVSNAGDNPKEVLVHRKIPLQMEGAEVLTYVPKYANGDLSAGYKQWVEGRLAAISQCLKEGGRIPISLGDGAEQISFAASEIETISKLYERYPEIAIRYAQHRCAHSNSEELVRSFDQLRDSFKEEKKKEGLSDETKKAFADLETKVLFAEAFVKKHPSLFTPPKAGAHPLIEKVEIDWKNERILLLLHSDVKTMLQRDHLPSKAIVEQWLIDEAAKIARSTNEHLGEIEGGYAIALHSLQNTTGHLALDLETLGKSQIETLIRNIRENWHPNHPDLKQLKIVTAEEYSKLSLQSKSLCLIVSSPAADEKPLFASMHPNSIYVVARGIDRILKSYAEAHNSEPSRQFMQEFRSLAELLSQQGFVGYPSTTFDHSQDFVFESGNFYAPLIEATRENFQVLGGNKKAVLELSDVEQRILTLNRIETKEHEELLKYHDEYRSAQVSLNPAIRWDAPKPTRSIFWSNVKLSLRKFFRGDERKILRWGLDLSGGKTVQIELRDQNNRVVTDDASIRQGLNELFQRVNKMGVSDVSIRQVGNKIVLDFPGSQSLSASELVKASSMYFHIVNEKYSGPRGAYSSSAQRFLEEVWNEAVVSNRKDPESIQAIAVKHLYGEGEVAQPRSESGRVLYESGLRLAKRDDASGQIVEDTASKVVVMRGDSPQQWYGQTHPLLIVFHNYALEGSQLGSVRANYDPSKGNFLSFDVSGSQARANIHAWTSQYSKEQVMGTAREAFSNGKGWRMAVILNDSVISAPTLESALKDSASISGSFTQREVNQLVSDLQAGSLTYTPRILSEQNVSPELGQSDRVQGIAAAFAALVLVVASMIVYYRFSGVIASIAVLFNLLILWATLQNLGASISLAAIAGIILTVGMAVDANVLVFERIKEEFALTGRISSAIQAGYAKAFSAILDSNVTTIIAALILMNFDAGPIKAFAISMIIGIASSMFTALFMTRFYFTGWMRNPKNTALSMASWIRSTQIDFLKRAKPAFAIALAIIGVGLSLLIWNKSTALGMDFTGGYAVHLEIEKSDLADPLAGVQEALMQGGAAAADFQIRQFEPSTKMRILLGTTMEQPGKPFYQMPLEVDAAPGAYSYLKNPRIQWVVETLSKSHIALTAESHQTLHSNWTAMSGQMSDSMRNNAILGLAVAFLAIFIYIAIRFEYKYAISAILCLLHDVFITLGCIGILHALKMPIQIDLNTIAALMTIIGYSLNDTIIIFDRIREQLELNPKLSLLKVLNRSINETLSRTAITSGTTLLALLALLAFGGATIFSFSLVMVIGVVFGTLSSWFIASPLLLFFHRKEEKKERYTEVT